MGTFSTKTGNDGLFYFNLKAGNGQVILTSQGYTTVSARSNGIESVRKNSQDDSLYDKQTTEGGKHYFNLKSSNGQVIGKSQMYADLSGRDGGIASVKTNAPDAEEVEE